MSNPLVSIIIPTFNRAHLIGETLDSVLAQTYQNWECIVVDDGSADGTNVMLAEYCEKDERIQYFKRPVDKPKGANACRNFGYENSKGEYIQWFDSDDLMHPDKLKIKIKHALAEAADIIVDTHTIEKTITLGENPNIEVFESEDFYVDYILGKKPVITNDVMVRQSVVGSLRFDENLHKAQEYEFFTRLFAQHLKYCFVDLPLTYYKKSIDSISKNTSRCNPLQVESLIYLSKLIKNRHIDNPDIVARAERQGRKTYKNLVKRGNYKMVLKHFDFFREVHHKSALLFGGYVLYNGLTGRGFDSMKPVYK
ncbi:glycosyltransferase family 2 protein [Gelidibacter japonicus]|uniref:glycosyltransferase family 2 protein n=1 Tax=Gelidibacter japonicus TaxID=1962232 RepID=UPI003A8FB635